MQDHQVDVVRTQALERLIDGGGAFEERRPELRLEDISRGPRGRAHAAPDGSLVHVHVRRVDECVAVVQRVSDRRLGVIRLQQVRAEADLGNSDAVIQGDEVHVSSSFSSEACAGTAMWQPNCVDAADCQPIVIPGSRA